MIIFILTWKTVDKNVRVQMRTTPMAAKAPGSQLDSENGILKRVRTNDNNKNWWVGLSTGVGGLIAKNIVDQNVCLEP